MADGQVGRDEVLLLVDGCDVGFLDFFADYLLKEDESDRARHIGREGRRGMGVKRFDLFGSGLLVVLRVQWNIVLRLTGMRSAYF